MDITLHSPHISGTVRAPSSKSEAHRALIVAALADLYGVGDDVRMIRCSDLNEDIEATVRCLTALGAHIVRQDEHFAVIPIKSVPSHVELDCGESGSTLRFLLPIVCALGALDNTSADFSAHFIGHGRLPRRPLSPLYEELIAHGASLSPQGSNPLIVRGQLSPGRYTIDGSVSSQFISGLLFALPLLSSNSDLSVTGNIESAPYIEMTLDALSSIPHAIEGDLPAFHIRGKAGRTSLALKPYTNTMDIGGDWSGAAFFLTAGLLTAPGCAITVMGLNSRTRQGDAAIIDILRNMGGHIEFDTDGNVTAHASRLRGSVIDARQVPDLVPILAVAASVAEGETRITGASRLRIKESDRLATVTAMLSSLGADISETADGLLIRGVLSLHGGTVDAAGDHRIAMSAAVAATVAHGEVTIRGAEAVAKSYPAFWEDYASISEK